MSWLLKMRKLCEKWRCLKIFWMIHLCHHWSQFEVIEGATVLGREEISLGDVYEHNFTIFKGNSELVLESTMWIDDSNKDRQIALLQYGATLKTLDLAKHFLLVRTLWLWPQLNNPFYCFIALFSVAQSAKKNFAKEAKCSSNNNISKSV